MTNRCMSKEIQKGFFEGERKWSEMGPRYSENKTRNIKRGRYVNFIITLQMCKYYNCGIKQYKFLYWNMHTIKIYKCDITRTGELQIGLKYIKFWNVAKVRYSMKSPEYSISSYLNTKQSNFLKCLTQNHCIFIRYSVTFQ